MSLSFTPRLPRKKYPAYVYVCRSAGTLQFFKILRRAIFQVEQPHEQFDIRGWMLVPYYVMPADDAEHNYSRDRDSCFCALEPNIQRIVVHDLSVSERRYMLLWRLMALLTIPPKNEAVTLRHLMDHCPPRLVRYPQIVPCVISWTDAHAYALDLCAHYGAGVADHFPLPMPA